MNGRPHAAVLFRAEAADQDAGRADMLTATVEAVRHDELCRISLAAETLAGAGECLARHLDQLANYQTTRILYIHGRGNP